MLGVCTATQRVCMVRYVRHVRYVWLAVDLSARMLAKHLLALVLAL